MGAIAKGRLREYGLTENGSDLSPDENEWFFESSKLNDLASRIRQATTSFPLAPTQFQSQLRLHE